MKPIKLQVSDEFHETIKAYAASVGDKSWNHALLELARAGYAVQTGRAAPEAVAAWGKKLEALDESTAQSKARLKKAEHERRKRGIRSVLKERRFTPAEGMAGEVVRQIMVLLPAHYIPLTRAEIAAGVDEWINKEYGLNDED